ncbi:hypothetical protein HOK51_08135 [Candidatus Woesearchaeota archaeon]|jgi:hypothetical protein|nr:hypothetical protein [Candidatus Woesearchaeota archaeon]MBT6519793.1 hypothetical protein [Candidatus Woesearchaeota archaeon]MBT7368172.1 hypothetical protein [Candidatus Woesearchaeota archaeon]
MTTQINLRLTEDFFEQAKEYAKANGFLNVQEFFREAAREKLFKDVQVRPEYLERLNSKEANTFLTESEAKEFENELKKRVMLN